MQGRNKKNNPLVVLTTSESTAPSLARSKDKAGSCCLFPVRAGFGFAMVLRRSDCTPIFSGSSQSLAETFVASPLSAVISTMSRTGTTITQGGSPL